MTPLSLVAQSQVGGFAKFCLAVTESDLSYPTVQALLSTVRTRDCVKAEGLLLERTSLNLSDRGLKDISPLRFFSKLQYLHLKGNEFTSLEPLKELAHLEYLSLSGNPLGEGGKTVLRSLLAMRDLWHLDLERCGLSSVLGVESLVQLRELWVRNNQVSDLTPLGAEHGFINLEDLDLSANPILDLRPLRSLARLESLNLAETRPLSLEPLKDFRALRSLDLRSSDIKAETDLEFLLRLETLRDLQLSGNKIRTVNALGQMRHLEYLHLEDNPLSGPQQEYLRDHLPDTYLFF